MRLTLLSLTLALWATPLAADVVSDWTAIAQVTPDGRPVPPPLQDQAFRTANPLAALAMFEAANMIDHRYRSYLGLAPQRGGDATAAVAEAAYQVLVRLQPDRKAALDQALEISLAGLPQGSALDLGRAVGRIAAEAALKRSLFAGPALEAYRPAGEPGRFVPPALPLIQTWFVRAEPFFLSSLDEAMPPAPPPITGARYAADLNEVKRIGGKGQAEATPQARSTALFLASFDYEPLVTEAAAAKPRLVDRARLWALVRMAEHDAGAMIGVAKMRYQSWRPINAIRNADRDDNPATERVADWEPVLPTPNHPEYPCGHCTMSGLVAALLAPELKGPIHVRSSGWPAPVSMTFKDWTTFQDAASLARIQGGMHFRFSNEAGQAMGRRVGEIARARFAPPIR